MTDYVLTGLVKLRAETTGEIEALPKKLQKLLADLKSLDATILQFDLSHKRWRQSGRALFGLQAIGRTEAKCHGSCSASFGKQPSQ